MSSILIKTFFYFSIHLIFFYKAKRLKLQFNPKTNKYEYESFEF